VQFEPRICSFSRTGGRTSSKTTAGSPKSIHYLSAGVIDSTGAGASDGFLGDFRMRGTLVLWAAAFFTAALIEPAAALLFPSANVGDAFTGTFTIDPTIPALPPPSLPGQYFGQIGTINVNIGGGIFTETITTVGGNGRYYLGDALGGCCDAALNGTSIGGYISAFLYGSTTSTGSILPQSLSAYASSQITIAGGDGTTYAEYDGFFSTLTQVDSSALFSFTGILTNVDIHLVDGGSGVSAIPEPSTWAMLLIGFAGIGGLSYRRRRSFMISTVAC
jgi:PEP-CTERM motif